MIKNPIIKYFLIFWLITLATVIVIGVWGFTFGKEKIQKRWEADVRIVAPPWADTNACKTISNPSGKTIYHCYDLRKVFAVFENGKKDWELDVGEANIVSVDGNGHLFVWKRENDKDWIVTVYDYWGGKYLQTLPKITIPNEGYPSRAMLKEGKFILENERVCPETGYECMDYESKQRFIHEACPGTNTIFAFDQEFGRLLWEIDSPLLNDFASNQGMRGGFVSTNQNVLDIGWVWYRSVEKDVSVFDKSIHLYFDLETGELINRVFKLNINNADKKLVEFDEKNEANTSVTVTENAVKKKSFELDGNWLEFTFEHGLKISPVLEDSALLVESPGKLAVVDLKDGKYLWKKEMNYFGTLLQSSNRGLPLNIGLYVRDADNMKSADCAAVEVDQECVAPEKDAEFAKKVDACLEELKESKVRITAIDLKTGKTLWTY
jgi:hypothetical protein